MNGEWPPVGIKSTNMIKMLEIAHIKCKIGCFFTFSREVAEKMQPMNLAAAPIDTINNMITKIVVRIPIFMPFYIISSHNV